MTPILSAEHQRVLEATIRQSEEYAASLHGLARLEIERRGDLATRVLHALGPAGTEDERRDAARRLKLAMPGGEWTDERAPRTGEEHRRLRAQKRARATTLGWLGHPAVAREVAAARAGLEALVEPLGMPDQLTITQVTARLLGATAFSPDGTAWPDPFAGAPTELKDEARRIQPLYIAALHELASRIAGAGAKLDPSDEGVLIVLAQLALTEPNLSGPATELVDALSTWPPGWIDRDAAAQGHPAIHASRHGADGRFMRDLSASAMFLARLYGPPPIPSPYAAGGRRAKPRQEHQMKRRRRALAQVLEAFPDATTGELRRTWELDATTPGGLLRTTLGLQPHDPAPPETTLRRDLRQIG